MSKNGAAFKARVSALYPQHPKLFRKSVLSIRDGGGVIEKLLGGGKYRRVLEIGTWRGVGAAFMAQFVEHVDTIDLMFGQLEREELRDGWDRMAFWQTIGADNIDLHLVEDDADKADVIGSLDFDFALIDGNHSAASAAADFAMVRRCGAVLFHDYDEKTGVRLFVDTLPRDQVTIMDIFAFWQADARAA